jgi:hypothetical protein
MNKKLVTSRFGLEVLFVRQDFVRRIEFREGKTRYPVTDLCHEALRRADHKQSNKTMANDNGPYVEKVKGESHVLMWCSVQYLRERTLKNKRLVSVRLYSRTFLKNK